jgi:hypothetical protein
VVTTQVTDHRGNRDTQVFGDPVCGLLTAQRAVLLDEEGLERVLGSGGIRYPARNHDDDAPSFHGLLETSPTLCKTTIC